MHTSADRRRTCCIAYYDVTTVVIQTTIHTAHSYCKILKQLNVLTGVNNVTNQGKSVTTFVSYNLNLYILSFADYHGKWQKDPEINFEMKKPHGSCPDSNFFPVK